MAAEIPVGGQGVGADQAGPNSAKPPSGISPGTASGGETELRSGKDADSGMRADAAEKELAEARAELQMERETADLQRRIDRETIAQQAAVINSLRVKLHRLFFGVKEALQFLGAAEGLAADLKGSADHESRHNAGSVDDSQPIVCERTGSTLSFSARDRRRNIEMQLTERARLACVHLRKAEMNVGDVFKATQVEPLAGPAEADANVGDLPPLPLDVESGTDNVPLSSLKADKRPEHTPRSDASRTPDVKIDLQFSLTGSSEEGDLGNSSFATPSATQVRDDCVSCKRLSSQLEQNKDLVATLRTELRRVWAGLAEERAHREKAQMSKDILEQELEELTAQLFDQANRMVVEETRLRVELETANRDLNNQILRLTHDLKARDDMLRSFNHHGHNHHGQGDGRRRARSSKSSLSASRPDLAVSAAGAPAKRAVSVSTSYLRGSKDNVSTPATSAQSLVEDIAPVTFVDAVLLAEFADHLKVANSLLPYNPVEAHSTAFLRRCLVEDVEPCLFFSFGSGLSGGNLWKVASTLATGLKKRLLETVVAGNCHVRPTSEDGAATQSSLVLSNNSLQVAQKIKEAITDVQPNFAPPSTQQKCWLCSGMRECDHRLFLHPSSSASQSREANGDAEDVALPEGGQLICLWCKERINAVRAFYEFMRSLQIAPNPEASELELFRQAITCRQQMAIARVGSISGGAPGDDVSPGLWSPCPWFSEHWESKARLVR
ncbi:hypothetical protein DFJ74DRAFT_643337 [Hyaloraphidium curvatum]|nr:hypothetical protein DFJ74DRAFT_643337 [Hyaloraphidium curvatum]